MENQILKIFDKMADAYIEIQNLKVSHQEAFLIAFLKETGLKLSEVEMVCKTTENSFVLYYQKKDV